MRLHLLCLAPAVALALGAAAAHTGDAPVVTGAWSRATPPGVSVGAAYLVITGGDKADRLTGASSERAEMIDLHDVVEEDGVARMRPLEELEIPAGKRVELAPKRKHLMLMGLNAPLVAGQTYVLVLQFAESGEQKVTVTVRAATAEPAHQH